MVPNHMSGGVAEHPRKRSRFCAVLAAARCHQMPWALPRCTMLRRIRLWKSWMNWSNMQAVQFILMSLQLFMLLVMLRWCIDLCKWQRMWTAKLTAGSDQHSREQCAWWWFYSIGFTRWAVPKGLACWWIYLLSSIPFLVYPILVFCSHPCHLKIYKSKPKSIYLSIAINIYNLTQPSLIKSHLITWIYSPIDTLFFLIMDLSIILYIYIMVLAVDVSTALLGGSQPTSVAWHWGYSTQPDAVPLRRCIAFDHGLGLRSIWSRGSSDRSRSRAHFTERPGMPGFFQKRR